MLWKFPSYQLIIRRCWPSQKIPIANSSSSLSLLALLDQTTLHWVCFHWLGSFLWWESKLHCTQSKSGSCRATDVQGIRFMGEWLQKLYYFLVYTDIYVTPVT